jgi:hypothetical protein
MQNSTYTLKLNLPNNHVLSSLHPISRGPYSGDDILMVMDDLCGNAYIVRSTLDGKHLSVSEMFPKSKALDVVKTMISKQNEDNCSAVTGGGRWSCQ